MKLEQSFGKVLKDLRSKKGISQEDLADFAKLDRTYISLLERGLRQPTLKTIFSLEKALNLSPSEIISKVQRAHEGGK
jgi:transcriptional regulator with XRE-family HTH domain